MPPKPSGSRDGFNRFAFAPSPHPMSTHQAVIASYTSHASAEAAIKELQKAGFDLKTLSIVGRDYQSDEHVIGYYNIGDRMKAWGKNGAFWGGMWGLLFGSAFFWIPGVGPLLVAGPFAAAILAALEGAAMIGGVSAIGASLYSIGIPKDSILRYETALSIGHYLLIVHAPDATVLRAKELLGHTQPDTLVHHASATTAVPAPTP